jgi:hypothetical protein
LPEGWRFGTLWVFGANGSSMMCRFPSSMARYACATRRAPRSLQGRTNIPWAQADLAQRFTTQFFSSDVV